MPLEQQVCQLADTKIYFNTAGTGPSLLLIHGSLCDYRYWRWQIEALAANYNLLIPSLRGCWPDTSNHPLAGYNTEQHAKDLIAFLQHIRPGERVHILGHSRGTQIATKMALLAPDLCASITLADPSFRFTDEPETTPFYIDTVPLLKAGKVDQALEMFVDTVNGETTWKKMTPWFKEMALANAMTLLSQVNETSFAFAANDIKSILSPIFLINGKNSPTKYKSRSKRIQNLIPTAQSTQIAMAAHGMNLANPRAFNRAVLGFLDNLN